MGKLTHRQRQVVCLAPFLSNNEIGAVLGMSRTTVRDHLQRIYRALGVPDYPNKKDKRVAAIIYALRDGETDLNFAITVWRRHVSI